MPALPDPSRSPIVHPLLRLLASNDLMESVWEPRELPALWLHQLAAPIVSELRAIDPAWALLAEGLGKTVEPPLLSFADLFACQAPPLSMLDLVKRYAKHHLQEGMNQLPRPIAGAVYVIAIATALARCGESISSQPRCEIESQSLNLAAQPWLDADTRRRLHAMASQK